MYKVISINPQEESGLLSLPNEILLNVLSCLGVEDLLNLVETCRRMYCLTGKSIGVQQLDVISKDKKPEAVYKLVFNLHRQQLLTPRCDAQVDNRLREAFNAIILSNLDGRAKCVALADIAKLVAEAGDVEKARAIFERALSIADGIPDPGSKSRTLVHIAKLAAEIGNFDDALNIAERIPDVYSKSFALAEIAIQVAGKNYFDTALSIAERISGNYLNLRHKLHGVTQIAKLVAKTGAFERALSIARGMLDKGYQQDCLIEIAKLAEEKGNVALAEQIREEAANLESADVGQL